MPYKVSVMTPQNYGRAMGRDGVSECYDCGDELKIYSKFVSKMGTGGRAKPKRYCHPCGKRLNLI